MPDWKSDEEIHKDFAVCLIFIWISLGVSLHDHITAIPFDCQVLVGKRSRRWPQLFYFLVKIFWWAYISACIIFCYATSIDCQASMNGIEFLMGAVAISCSVLLACRTLCVWTGTARKIVGAFLTILTLGLTAAWMVGVRDVTATWAPTPSTRPWADGACDVLEVPNTYIIKYLILVAYDFAVLVLTVAGLMQSQSAETRLGQMLISQGILYFVATFVANAIVCALCLARLNPVMSLIGAAPSSCVSMIAATRLYSELAQQGRPPTMLPEERRVRRFLFSAGTPLSSFFSTSRKSSASKKVDSSDLEKNSQNVPELGYFSASSSQAVGDDSSRFQSPPPKAQLLPTGKQDSVSRAPSSLTLGAISAQEEVAGMSSPETHHADSSSPVSEPSTPRRQRRHSSVSRKAVPKD